jgi:hypothetical protein
VKTATYLRLSLLLPFLVWGVCLLFVIAVTASPIDELISSESTTIAGILYLFFMFYALGIVIWFFPYLLLSLILFALSFIIQARTAIKVFALSPIAMTVLTIASMNLLFLGSSGNGQMLSSPLIKDQDFIYFNLLVLAFSLIWSYLCVGIGFGIYQLLQHSRIVRDEETVEARLRPINQHE